MIGLPANTRVWLVAGQTDMRRGFDGLAAMVQTALAENPFSGHVFVFRGRRGDIIKVLWFDGQGLCLYAKRLERGRFVWPQAESGAISLTPAQLSMLLEGIDWRMPQRTWQPEAVRPLSYVYDFGDYWDHRITIEKTQAADTLLTLPFCIGGAGATPPEDCGGAPGYAEFVRAMADPTDSEHAHLAEWIGVDSWDPKAFDSTEANDRLAEIKL